MAITEGGRHHLHIRLEEVLGTDEANLLMEYLPPVGWADVATRRDLDHVETLLRSDLKSVEGRLTGEIERVEHKLTGEFERVEHQLTGKIERVEHKLTGKIERVEHQLRGEIERVEHQLRGEIKQSASDTIRTLMFGMIASNATLVGLVFAAVRFGGAG